MLNARKNFSEIGVDDTSSDLCHSTMPSGNSSFQAGPGKKLARVLRFSSAGLMKGEEKIFGRAIFGGSSIWRSDRRTTCFNETTGVNNVEDTYTMSATEIKRNEKVRGAAIVSIHAFC